jgi:dTDP-4-dehydrorhamnose reductase
MILITGSTGLLGSTLVPWLRSRGKTIATHARQTNADYTADLVNKRETFELLNRIQPSVIVNLVGLTSVERCQDNANESYLVNTRTVENIVNWILDNGSKCHLIQISTDQVYDGSGIHTEDQVCLTNNYAFSKYAGELASARVPSTILRTNFVGRSKIESRESLTDWVYNSLTNGRHVQVLQDVYFSPLSMKTLVEMIQLVIENKPVGIFNLGSKNGMSKAEFDFYFAEQLNLSTKTMTRIDSSQAEFLRAYRPKDMRMDSSKFERTMNIQLPTLVNQIQNIAKEYYAEAK